MKVGNRPSIYIYEKRAWNGDKQSSYVWTPILCFSTDSKLVQALVTAYDEIFQGPVAEADILLLKPLLNLRFDGVVRRKLLTSEMFLKFAKHRKACRGQFRAV